MDPNAPGRNEPDLRREQRDPGGHEQAVDVNEYRSQRRHLIVPLFDLLMFAIFFAAAIYYRKKPAAHKSLMLLTAVNFLPPAVARIPVGPLQSLGPLWFFGFPTVVALVCLGLETWRYRRLNRVFLLGTLLLIASYVVRLMIMGTGAWMEIAQWLTSFVWS